MKEFEEAVEIYSAIVWAAIPVIWIPIAILGIWVSNLLDVIPIEKIAMTHGLLLVCSIIAIVIDCALPSDIK